MVGAAAGALAAGLGTILGLATVEAAFLTTAGLWGASAAVPAGAFSALIGRGYSLERDGLGSP